MVYESNTSDGSDLLTRSLDVNLVDDSSSDRSVPETLVSTTDSDSGSNKHGSVTVKDATLQQILRRPSLLDEDEQPTSSAAAVASASTSSPPSQPNLKDEPVTWLSLPKKGQLAILTLARLSEPLAERSLAAYMFYQLRSFDPNLPDSTITSQGGMLTAAFAAAQFVTAVWWGRAADTPWIGRKRVLLVGLFGTALASIGVGFSKTFAQALCFRALAGALNGNIGVMRTMISEMVKEKKFQSRAFLLLPMCFNIGVIIGPILGGFLADPITSFPRVFGPGSIVGGKDGVGWMQRFPYGLPNLFSGVFITMSALAVIFGLDETHQALRDKPDRGRRIGKWLFRTMCHRGQRNSSYGYTQLSDNDIELEGSAVLAASQEQRQDGSRPSLDGDIERKPVRPVSITAPTIPKHQTSIFYILRHNTNVLSTLLSHHLLALHISTFNTLIFLFLPSPRSTQPPTSFLRFTGGLGLPSSKVGLATAIIGVIGFPLQILVYPPVHAQLGTLTGYRLFLPCSAISYTLLPFLTLLPNNPAVLWPALTLVLAAQVLSRTFTLTSTVILINNSSPSPAVLGTIHGVAQSVSSAARMLGPTIGGWGLGLGLRHDCVGAVWWAMSGLVLLNWTLLWRVYEGDGMGGKA